MPNAADLLRSSFVSLADNDDWFWAVENKAVYCGNNLTSDLKLPRKIVYIYQQRSGPNIEPWDCQEHCTNKETRGKLDYFPHGNLTKLISLPMRVTFLQFP